MGSGASMNFSEQVSTASQSELNNVVGGLNLQARQKIRCAIECGPCSEEVDPMYKSSTFFRDSEKVNVGNATDDDNVSTAAQSHEDIEVLQGPRIICGFEGLFAAVGNDLKTVGDLVAEILRDCGWGDVDRERIVVEDKSGEGGSKTFKVIGQPAHPSEIAVHARSRCVTEDPISEERAAIAAAVFGQAGVAPARIAQGGDWYIEAWEGITHHDLGDLTLDIAQDLGGLMASIHKTPVAWYDTFREQLCVLRPELASAALGSKVWKESCRMKHLDFMEKMDEVTWARWLANEPTPSNHINAKVVTCHGDFHRGNIIRMQNGVLKAIDLEFSCVMYAAEDLNYAFHACCKTLEMRRAFVDGYLRTSGEITDAETIDAVIFDIECYATISQKYWENMRATDKDVSNSILSIEKWQAIRDEAQNTVNLRKEIIEKGFGSCTPVRELRAEEKRNKYCALEPMLPLTMTNHSAPPVVELATLPSPAVPEEYRPRWPLNITSAQFSCACWVALQPSDESSPEFFQVMTLCAAEVGKGLGDFCMYLTEGVLTFSLDGNEAEHRKGGDVEFKLHHIADGTWHHLACLYDSTEMYLSLFLDGVRVESRKFEMAFPVRLTSVSVGERRAEGDERHMVEGTRFLEGNLRDFSMHTYILSDDDISQMYTSACDAEGKPRFELPYVAPTSGVELSEDQKQEMVCVLISMGIPEDRAAEALNTTRWVSVESALAVAMGSIQVQSSRSTTLSDHEKLEMLEQVKALGFDDEQARAVLDATGWTAAEVAIAHLFGD